MSRFNTGNPIPSTSLKDLSDNAQIVDDYANSAAPSTNDRFGKRRKTWAGFEAAFAQFLLGSGYQFLGDYDDDGPLTISLTNQTFTKDGEFWRAGPGLTLPYTTVNDWVVDQPKFVMNGDNSLRSELNFQQAFAFNVKDKRFGALGNYTNDDTAAIQAAFDALPNTGGSVFFPPGRYKLTQAIVLPNAPVRIFGAGQSASLVIQTGAGQDGFRFTVTGSNNVSGSGTLFKNLELEDLSILRGVTNGGSGVNANWLAMTNNQTLFYCNNVQIYNDNNGGLHWGSALRLSNCCGSKITNTVLRGNIFESSIDLANPYTMEACIDFTGDSGSGQINHYIDNVTTTCSQNAIRISSWYEGIYITNCEFVQHYRGVYAVGDALKQNPNLFIMNTHMDIRYRAIDATNILKLKITQCDLFKAGHANGTGYAGTLVNLVGCTHWSVTGSNLSSIDSIMPVGINADANSYRGSAVGNLIQSCSFGFSAFSTGNMVGNNVFYQCGTAIQLQGAGNNIGVNVYDGCTVNINLVNSSNWITPVSYSGQHPVTFASSLTEQIVAVPIPAGTFSTVPAVGILQPGFNVGSFSVAVFDRAASSATSAVFRVRDFEGAAIPAGSYSFSVLLQNNP